MLKLAKRDLILYGFEADLLCHIYKSAGRLIISNPRCISKTLSISVPVNEAIMSCTIQVQQYLHNVAFSNHLSLD